MKFQPSKLEPVLITIDGVEYPAKLTFRGLAEIEELFGMGFFKVFEKFSQQDITVSELISILYIMLKCGGVEVDKEDLNEIEFSVGIIDSMSQVLSRANKVNSLLQDKKTTGKKKKK